MRYRLLRRYLRLQSLTRRLSYGAMSKNVDELSNLLNEMSHTRARNDCPNCAGNKFGGIKVVVHEKWKRELDKLYNAIKVELAAKDTKIAELESQLGPVQVAAELVKKRK